MNILETALYLAGSTLAGYGLFFLILKFLPGRLTSENQIQRQEVLKEAKRQTAIIMDNAAQQAQEQLTLDKEELEGEIEQRKADLEQAEQLNNGRQSFVDSEANRISKKEQTIKGKENRLKGLRSEYAALTQSGQEMDQEIIDHLARKANENSENLQKHLVSQVLEKRQLNCQKVLKNIQEELSASARKKAQRILDRTHNRYSPNFLWPKTSNSIELTNPSFLEKKPALDQLLSEIAELSETEVNWSIPEENQPYNPSVRFSGGFGPFREAATRSFAEILKQPQRWHQSPKGIFTNHKNSIDREMVVLGKKAVNILELENIHPEIQKLIGSLNWRTSYRQNQWYHTVEVAILAGILATELGEDPQLAKRVGLLHDVGKAIDYRIDGSHAVISGDYADRFGENRLICDTVMSHHADLLVETPLAYILRSADTLSGARPGARVNLEEGYQIRLSAIAEAVHSFPGIEDLAIMNGGREIHVQVSPEKVREKHLKSLTADIIKKIEDNVAYPGQIKILVSRTYESISVA